MPESGIDENQARDLVEPERLRRSVRLPAVLPGYERRLRELFSLAWNDI
ncbi:hypothetical protein AB0I53_15865 [Saccharopolyspora sp. NPDC050389]